MRALAMLLWCAAALAAEQPAAAAALPIALPALPPAWSDNPFDAAGLPSQIVIDASAQRIGPLALGGQTLNVQVDAAAGSAALHRDGVPDAATVSVQRFFRRLAIGPLPQPGERAAWILLRQGQVRVVERPATATFDDELAFDLAFDALDLSPLDAAQRERWEAAYWARESALMEAALHRREAALSPTPPPVAEPTPTDDAPVPGPTAAPPPAPAPGPQGGDGFERR